jgi:S1-C subfamily serine protease
MAIASCASVLFTAGTLTAQAASKTPEAAKPAATAPATSTAPAEKAGVMASPHNGSAWFGAIVENAEVQSHKGRQVTHEVRITKVIHGSPASAAGLKAGDILWSFDGGRLQNTSQFHKELRAESPGATVPLAIYRHGQKENLKVTLGEIHHTTAPKTGSAEHARA